ncbi:DinB family protein [Lysobacter dokdonensis DS-58]|uniref:DinB family protein n=1 Tax=Lysobacter dokdonensis DS-58 TaxID=1300345 RepID=A0A0A2WCV9_9GAMM|nr:DinB family protein [Lysobacter dokdonensis]KGQ17961.1 DinB family protein [Lysobacter dokdonensis DS-58]
MQQSIAALIAALAQFPQHLRTHYATIPPARARFRPATWDGCPSEHFDPLEQLWHVRDIERDGYHVRFRRTLEEDAPVLADIDSYALAASKGERGTAEQALDEFADARAHTVGMLSALTAEQLDRPAQFEGYGPITVRGLMHLLCSHDHQHLSGLQWLAAKGQE